VIKLRGAFALAAISDAAATTGTARDAWALPAAAFAIGTYHFYFLIGDQYGD